MDNYTNGSTNGAANGKFNGNGAAALRAAMMPVIEQDAGIDLSDYWRAIVKGKWVILIVFLAGLSFSIFFAYSQYDIYEASTKVLVRDSKFSGPVKLIGYDFSELRGLANELEILRSRTLAEQVAMKLLQNIYVDPLEKKDTLSVVKAATGKGLARYDEIAQRILSGMTVRRLGETDMLLIGYVSTDAPETAIISRTVADAYGDRNKKSSQNAASVLRKFLEDQLDRKRRQLVESEEELQRFIEQNKIVSPNDETSRLIGQQSSALALMEASGVDLGALEAALTEYKKQIEALNPKLANSVVQGTLDSYTKGFQAQIATLEIERDKIATDPNSQSNANVQQKLKLLNDQIDAYKKRLQEAFELQVKKGMANLTNVDQIMNLYRTKLQTELQIVSAQTRYNLYKRQADEYERRFIQAPERSIGLMRLQRKQQSALEIYNLIEKRYSEALIAQEQVPSSVEIIDYAIPPLYPFAPNRRQTMFMGGLIGLVAGIGLVLLIQFLDRTIHTPEHAERLGVPLLATIPVIETFDETVRNKSGASVKVVEGPDAEYKKIASHLVTHFDPKSSVSEAYRALRTSILFSISRYSDSDKPEGKIFVVTSSSPKEGKSTTISNLAITIAQGGNKVLLIDTDLRRPVIHAIFGYNKEPGLTNYLVGRAKIDDTIRTSLINNLDIMTSGTVPPNPSELISTPRMLEFLDEMRRRYDVVLMDSPPVMAVTDAQILSKITDGTIMIVASGQTQSELAKRSRDLIQKVGGRIVGAVLNNFNLSNSYGSYYKYYRYYNYYYDSKNTAPLKRTFLERLADGFSSLTKV